MNIRIHLQRRVVSAFALALCALVAIDIVSYRTSVQYAESVDVVKRTHRAVAMLEAAVGDLVSAESEVRGYVITADNKFLELYRSSITEVKSDLKELDGLVLNPVSREYLAEFTELARARLARLEVTVEIRQQAGFEAVRQATGPGKNLMDQLRQVASRIEERQDHLLAERVQNTRTLAHRTISVIVIGSIFAVALVGTSTILLRKHIAQQEMLEREVLEVSEREQRRIGQDLHDGVCQQLTGVSLMSRSLQQRLGGPLAVEAAQITQLINESIEQARRVTRGLHPVPDEPMGLVVAIKELADRVASGGKISCRLVCDQPVPVPDRVAATNLYRITQEAVQNALRHATPKNIEIALKRDDQMIRLTVTDDGCGLPSERSGGGLGLEIMDYRARAIGATLEARRGESGGTIVSCTLPLDSLA